MTVNRHGKEEQLNQTDLGTNTTPPWYIRFCGLFEKWTWLYAAKFSESVLWYVYKCGNAITESACRNQKFVHGDN